ADFDADQLAFGGGAGLKRASARAVDRDGMIVGVNSFFHERLLFGWPVCVTRSMDEHSHVARPAEKPQLYGIRRHLQNQRNAAPTMFWATLSEGSVFPCAS